MTGFPGAEQRLGGRGGAHEQPSIPRAVWKAWRQLWGANVYRDASASWGNRMRHLAGESTEEWELPTQFEKRGERRQGGPGEPASKWGGAKHGSGWGRGLEGQGRERAGKREGRQLLGIRARWASSGTGGGLCKERRTSETDGQLSPCCPLTIDVAAYEEDVGITRRCKEALRLGKRRLNPLPRIPLRDVDGRWENEAVVPGAECASEGKEWEGQRGVTMPKTTGEAQKEKG